jgi:glycine betaine/proline transport system permease protein
MSTATTTHVAAVDRGFVDSIRRNWRVTGIVGVIAAWIVAYWIGRGHDTKVIGGAATTSTHDWLARRSNGISDAAAKGDNPILSVTNAFANGVNDIVNFIQKMISEAAFPRPVPEIGWLGVIAIFAWITYALAGIRSTILVVLTFLVFGYLGYWQESLDLLNITFVAVGLCAIIGIPIGILMGRSRVTAAIITPILDVMQTLPSFVYLLPVIVIFGIGEAAAVIVTLVYALPPIVRITAHGIRAVPASAIEATTSLGQTRWQLLRKVQLPMAKRTIIVGINQSVMAALSMATIAALIDGPGLGKPVVTALQSQQLGTAFVAGLGIVLMAIMLDRTTTAASEHAEKVARLGTRNVRTHRIVLAVAAAVALVLVWVSRQYLTYAQFPTSPDLGTPIQHKVDDIVGWMSVHLYTLTNGVQNQFTVHILNPLQELVANSPWYVTGTAILALALLIGGLRALVSTALCLAGIYGLGLWNYSMITLTATLVATVIVVLIGVVVGVWIGRSKTADNVVRPLLDAGQTLPPFVYLIPILAFFGTNRFTAMVAGIIYAAPVAIKLVADGIRGVSATTIEAAEAAGSSRMQIIRKVQLPMARSSLVLAANQGLLYVLSMFVIGGMVGAGALGYDVVRGFSQSDYAGRGLAAGFSICLLGIMLDRITQAAARRAGGTSVSAR